jgi:hypothetical protein
MRFDQTALQKLGNIISDSSEIDDAKLINFLDLLELKEAKVRLQFDDDGRRALTRMPGV